MIELVLAAVGVALLVAVAIAFIIVYTRSSAVKELVDIQQKTLEAQREELDLKNIRITTLEQNVEQLGRTNEDQAAKLAHLQDLVTSKADVAELASAIRENTAKTAEYFQKIDAKLTDILAG